IEDEARRMNRLVTDLLDLARLDREASLQPVPTDLVALARDAIADAAAADPDRPLALDAPDTLIATVDESHMRQVFANLLANIRAHTPPGTSATVRLRPGVIEVTDDGPGMPPADAARAFERFHRAGHGAPGTGLGLPIVAAIAAAHDARAELFSAPSRRSAVRIARPHAVNAGQHEADASKLPLNRGRVTGNLRHPEGIMSQVEHETRTQRSVADPVRLGLVDRAATMFLYSAK